MIRGLIAIVGTVTVLLCGSVAWADTNYNAGTYGACQYGSCSITLSSNGTVSVNITPTSGGVCTIQSDSVSVLTDNTAGYTLTFKDSSTDSSLQNGAATIPVTSGTFASPAMLAANTWGYRIDSLGSFGSGPTSAQSNGSFSSLTFAKVPNSSASPDTLATTAVAADPAVTTTVWYGVCANVATVSGSYSSQVIYTATVN